MANNYNNTITLKFARAEQPKYVEKKGGYRYVEYGANNNYPDYLLSLFDESPKHGAIVKGKAKYIYGKGFNVPAEKNANTKGESWNKVFKKAVLDDEIFSGYYLQIIYNLLGKVKDVFHLEFYKVRVSKDLTKFYVKKDWKDSTEKIRCYPAFDNKYDKENPVKILFVYQYNPKADVYPKPEYFQGLNYIESDVQISRHILGNAKDGFVASTLINLNGGEPAEEQKEAVEKGLKNKFTGSEGDRVVIMFNKSKDNAAEILPLSSTMLTKEDFKPVNELIQQEIFACHQVTSPTLFGISTPGALGQRNEIQDAYEIFNNTYVNERQQAHEEVFNKLFNLVGIPGKFNITPVEPLGFQLSEDNLLTILPKEYFYDKLAIDQKWFDLPVAKAAPGLPAANAPTDASGNTIAVNENLAGMTGRKFQQLERIVKKYKNGKLTREQAAMMLKNSFGVNDDEIAVFLDADSSDQQFASQDEVEFALIEQFSQVGENKDDYEILGRKPAKESQYFADVKQLTELEANVLNLIKKDKRITPEVLATTLKTDVPVVEKIIEGLEKLGVIKSVNTKVGEDTITERTSTDKRTGGQKPTTTDILLRYSYDWRDIVPVNERNSADHPSRDFCVKMMALNKLYSRADIELISMNLGYSVWDRVGGWWNAKINPTPEKCRHEWHALTVIRKS